MSVFHRLLKSRGFPRCRCSRLSSAAYSPADERGDLQLSQRPPGSTSRATFGTNCRNCSGSAHHLRLYLLCMWLRIKFCMQSRSLRFCIISWGYTEYFGGWQLHYRMVNWPVPHPGRAVAARAAPVRSDCGMPPRSRCPGSRNGNSCRPQPRRNGDVV